MKTFEWPPLPEGDLDPKVMEGKINELVTKIGKLLQESGVDSGVAIAAAGRYISMYHANIWGHKPELAEYLQHDTYTCMESDFQSTLKQAKEYFAQGGPESVQ